MAMLNKQRVNEYVPFTHNHKNHGNGYNHEILTSKSSRTI